MKCFIQSVAFMASVIFALVSLPAGFAYDSTNPGDSNERIVQYGDTFDSPMSLVFSDDFSTDPNTNGLWTIHRYADDPSTEASWGAETHSWHLTRASSFSGVAVFANYHLIAHSWRAQFRYKVEGDADGFVFMFYKDKGAYGTPNGGSAEGFELNNGSTYGAPVAGYGLQFDNYPSGDRCEPEGINGDHIALIQDKVCSALEFHEDNRTNDNIWHTVQFAFAEGRIRIVIDGVSTFNYRLVNPDYTYSGIGFGAGTGLYFADHEIDNFQLWVAE